MIKKKKKQLSNPLLHYTRDLDPYKPLLLQEMQASTEMVQSWLGKHEASSKTYSMSWRNLQGCSPGIVIKLTGHLELNCERTKQQKH